MTVKKMEGKPNMALSAEDEVRETMTSKRLRVRIGYATAAAQEISGDQAMSCELPDGRFALILSDGMGKGAPAAAESRRLVRRLRGNLKKGMSPARAIKDVNCFMIKPDSFATMDLALLDWARGQAKFYKMGAASSFLIRGSADWDHSDFEVDASVGVAGFGRYYRYGIGRNYGGRQG